MVTNTSTEIAGSRRPSAPPKVKAWGFHPPVRCEGRDGCRNEAVYREAGRFVYHYWCEECVDDWMEARQTKTILWNFKHVPKGVGEFAPV